MHVLVLRPTLLCLTLWSSWALLMPVCCHPHHGPCRLIQRTALCNDGQLASVPAGLPDDLEELHLNHNHIPMLQDAALSAYPSLHSLSCAGSSLETVGSKAFHDAPRIESLNFAVNNLHVGYQETARALRTLSKLRALDLSENELSENMALVLLQNMTSLEYLNLSGNFVSRLDESSFRDLHKLKELDLQRNVLFEIDRAFDHMHQLQRLNLAFNYLPCLDEFQMTQLVVLNASHNSIEWFIANQALNYTFQLETLDLTDNKLLFFPFLPSRSRLHTLYLSQNRLSFYEHLSENTASPNWTTSVHFYNLRGNVSNITAQLWDEGLHGDISSLALLDLSCNLVAYFPQGFFSKMPVLSRLRMRTNCLEVLDLSQDKLSGSLYELDVSNNNLIEVRADLRSVKELGNLTHLNLSGNHLQRLPAGLFSSLPSLSSVDLSYNNVGICPSEGVDHSSSDCVVWTNVFSLRQLSLAGCNLGRLPASVFEGTPLTHLELSNNPRLIIEHRSIQGLSKTLQHLGLGNTGVRHFDFSPFQYLRSLNISANTLTQIPYSLLSLQLRLLDLRDNKLNTIPSAEANVLAQTLQTVFLNGNPFNCCQLDWFRTFESTKTLIIVDSPHIRCQDDTQTTRGLARLDYLVCGGEEGESILWYLLLFVPVCFSLVGISIIFLLTFRPRWLPKTIKNKCWRPEPY